MAFYSPARDDLFFPARRGDFFPDGAPDSEARLCAEMTRLAYCRRDDGFAFDRVQITDVLQRIGFNECRFFESPGSPRNGGTHVFLAQRAGADPARELTIVSFRGTDDDDPTDLGDDIDVRLEPWPHGGKVHTGFARGLREVQDGILDSLHTVNGRVLFAGHSFGGALATLLASVHPPSVLYTFGSPRVGDADFVAALNAIDARRFVDCCDLVTSLPPATFGYVHLGPALYIDRQRQLLVDPSSAAEEEDRRRARLDYLVEYAWRTGNVAIRDLADHSPINYVTAVP